MPQGYDSSSNYYIMFQQPQKWDEAGTIKLKFYEEGIWVEWFGKEGYRASLYTSQGDLLSGMFYNPNFQYKEQAVEETNITVMVNGEPLTFDQSPIMQNNRVLVPMRLIFETLGAAVEWDESTQSVKATNGNTIITMQIGNNTLVKNGENIVLDTAPILLNSRTLVPVRAVAEALDASVDWDGNTSTVIITTSNTTSNTTVTSKIVTEQFGENVAWVRAINDKLYLWDKKSDENIFKVWKVDVYSGNAELIAYAQTTPYCYSDDWIIFCGSKDGLTQNNVKYRISDGSITYQDDARRKPADGFYRVTGDYLLFYEYFQAEGKTGIALLAMNLITNDTYSILEFEEYSYWWTSVHFITDRNDPNIFYLRLKGDIQSSSNGQMGIDGLYKFNIKAVESGSNFKPESVYPIPEMVHTVIPLNKKVYLIADRENPYGTAGVYLAEMMLPEEADNFENHLPKLVSKYYCRKNSFDYATYSDGSVSAENCWIKNDAIYFRPVEPYNEQIIKIQDGSEKILNIGNKYSFDGILANDEVWYNRASDSKGNTVLGAYINGNPTKTIYFLGTFLTQDENNLYYYGYPYEPRRNEYNEFLDKPLGPKGIYKIGY